MNTTLIIDPSTLQPVPPGSVPSLPAPGESAQIIGITPATLALYAPGTSTPIITITAFTKNGDTHLYSLPDEFYLSNKIPTAQASLNGGSPFHIRLGTSTGNNGTSTLTEQIAAAVQTALTNNVRPAVQDALAGTPPIVTDEVTGKRLKLTAKNNALKTSPAN